MSKVGVKSQLEYDIKLFMGIQHGHKSDMETHLKKELVLGALMKSMKEWTRKQTKESRKQAIKYQNYLNLL